MSVFPQLRSPDNTRRDSQQREESPEAGWDQNLSFMAPTISILLSWGVESEVQLLPEGVPVVSVDELKHTLVDHI